MKNSIEHRQRRQARCRRFMRSIAILALWSSEAMAGELTLTWSSTQAATGSVAVSVSSNQTLLGFDWSAATWPRCRGETCTVRVDTPQCQRVRVEAIDLEGVKLRAADWVCSDPDSPRIAIEVDGREVRAASVAGVLPIRTQRVFFDGFVRTPPFTIEDDGNCHAIEAFAVDREGRMGVDRTSWCSKDAPRLWLGPAESSPSEGQSRTFCWEAVDPLGRTFDGMGGGCRNTAKITGLGLESMSVSVFGGPRAWGSLLTIAKEGYFELHASRTSEGDLVEIIGGRPPFETVAPATFLDRSAFIPVEDLGTEVIVRDAHGRTRRLSLLRPQSAAAFESSGAGCSSVNGDGLWAALSALFLGLTLRRRKS